MMEQMQRTPEWYLERKGKITASEVYLLLSDHKEEIPLTKEEQEAFRAEHPRAKMPETKKVDMPFSQQTFSYLDGKVAECYMDDDNYLQYLEECSYETKAMRWGTDHEAEAREVYKGECGVDVFEVGFIPLEGFDLYAGGSPDGIVRGEEGIIEIKCPFNPAIHLRHRMLKTPQDLKEENLQYYAQCQYNMMVTKREFCDFVSFDPRLDYFVQFSVLRIPRDEEMQAELRERTRLAVEYMNDRIQKINIL